MSDIKILIGNMVQLFKNKTKKNITSDGCIIILKDVIYYLFLSSETRSRIILKLHYIQENTVLTKLILSYCI